MYLRIKIPIPKYNQYILNIMITRFIILDYAPFKWQEKSQ